MIAVTVAEGTEILGDGSCGGTNAKMKDIVRRNNVNIDFQACQVLG